MSTEIDELRVKCKHPFIRERRSAIVRLAELMQNIDLHNEAKELLEDRAKNDDIQNIQILARSILNYFEKEKPTPGDPGQKHVFPVSCPHCQHICYYDKREWCSSREVYRGTSPEGLDELYLKCTNCGKPIKAIVNCEGYK